jgi:integrase/recombinase XerD
MKMHDAISGFHLFLITDNYSPVTAKYYKALLERISTHFNNPDIEDITTANLREYLSVVKTRSSGSTAQVHWKVIRSFYNWAEEELEIQRPDKDLAQPNFVAQKVMPLSHDDVTKLMKACKTKRDKAIITVLLDTGLRVSEFARLNVGDADLETGLVIVRSWSTGKKSRSRPVRLGKNSRRILWTYLNSRKGFRKTDPLIATKDDKPMDASMIRHVIYRIAKVAGVSGVHPHKFRHTFAVEYLRNGGDIFSLQELLGHSSLVMVRHYLQLSQTDLEETHRRASPVDNWRL